MWTIHLLWTSQSTDVRFIVLGVFAVVAILLVRSVRLARMLYKDSGEPLSPKEVVEGAVDPCLLAKSGLTNRMRRGCVPQEGGGPESSRERGRREEALNTLRTAERTFLYLWELCYTDMESIRSASALALMLSFAMVVYGAYPTFQGFSNESRLSIDECLQFTFFQQSTRLGVMMLVCTMLYMVSLAFKRVLKRRKICWQYFCARVENDLPRE